MAQEQITKLIRTEAEKQGVNPELAVQIATVESGLKPDAKNPKSSAAGLFQLIDRTRKELGGDPKKKFDPLENVRLGVQLIKQNEGKLMTGLGRRPTDHELYMAHLFGPTGAMSLINSDPTMPVQKAVLQFSSPKTAENIVKNNRLTGTVGDVLGKFQQKFGKKPITQQKTAPATKKPAAPEGPIPFTTGFDFADLGPSYQAAFALASLGMMSGEDEEKKPEEAKPAPVKPSQASSMLANLKTTEPLAFAKGGEVLEAPPVVVKPEEKPRTEAKSMLDKLLEQRKQMTSTLPGMAADIGASIVNPAYGTAASAADFETARREGDLLGMGLAGAGLIPVLGGMVRGGGKLMQRIVKEGAESGTARILPQREYTKETPFFSRLEMNLLDVSQNKASKEQWSGMIRNMPGVPKAEKDYLIEALQGIESKGPLTKDQVLEAFQPISARRFTGYGVRKGLSSTLYREVDNPFYADNGFFKNNKGNEMFLGTLKYTRDIPASEAKTFDEIAALFPNNQLFHNNQKERAEAFMNSVSRNAEDADFLFRDFGQQELESITDNLNRQFRIFTPRVGSGSALDRIRDSLRPDQTSPVQKEINNLLMSKAGLDPKEGERLYDKLMKLSDLNEEFLKSIRGEGLSPFEVESRKTTFLLKKGVGLNNNLERLAEDIKSFLYKKAEVINPVLGAKKTLYASEHFELPNSVLFSRMTPAEALDRATGVKENALYIHEIQPDWLKSRIRKGSPSDKAKDVEELSRLNDEYDAIASEYIKNQYKTGKEALVAELVDKMSKLSKRMNKLDERIASNRYDVSDLPGPLIDPRNAALVQQAGVKNAINIALQEGRDMVVFPIPDVIESASAKKYYNFEKGGPLRQSLEDTAKQLGKGFEVTQVELPEAANRFAGRLFPAIRILPEGRERIMRELKGIPFKDGGLVDKALSDNRKFV